MARFATLFALAGLLQADTGEQYFKFRPGTSWTYRQEQGGKSSKTVLTVTKEEGSRVTIESKEYREEGKPPRTSSIVWSAADGFLVWEEDRQGKQVLRVYKLGSKKDDTWKSSVAQGGEMDAVHMGKLEVKVPSGIYKDVVLVRMKLAQSQVPFTLDIYLAPNVGPVRMGGEVGDQRMLMELTEFKEGK